MADTSQHDKAMQRWRIKTTGLAVAAAAAAVRGERRAGTMAYPPPIPDYNGALLENLHTVEVHT